MYRNVYSQKQKVSGFCPHCGMQRVLYRRHAVHWAHAAISAGTLGIWLPAWLAVWLIERRLPWRCELCRFEVPPPSSPGGAQEPEGTPQVPTAGTTRSAS